MPLRLRVRVAGKPDFEVEVEVSETVAEAKIAITAGCEIDPEEMRIIHKGKMMKDDQTLQECGVDGSQPLMVARGARPATVSQSSVPVSSTSSPPEASAKASGCTGTQSGGIQVHVRGLGGAEFALEGLQPDESIASLRETAAQRCGLKPDEIHLLHKGRVLKIEDSTGTPTTLSSCGVADGNTLHVARRQVQTAEPKPAPAATVSMPDGSAGAPMPVPSGWDGGQGMHQALMAAVAGNAGGSGGYGGGAGATPNAAQQMLMLQELMRNSDVLARGGTLAQAQEAQGNQGWGRGQHMRAPVSNAVLRAQEQRANQQARMDQEVRMMGQAVRRLAAEAVLRRPDGRPAPMEEVDRYLEEEPGAEQDVIFAEVAQVMAQARAQGTPVPNASRFVDNAVERARARRALQTRMHRESSGIDPEIEDAMQAAHQQVSAANRAPRRLGGGPPPPREQ